MIKKNPKHHAVPTLSLLWTQPRGCQCEGALREVWGHLWYLFAAFSSVVLGKDGYDIWWFFVLLWVYIQCHLYLPLSSSLTLEYSSLLLHFSLVFFLLFLQDNWIKTHHLYDDPLSSIWNHGSLGCMFAVEECLWIRWMQCLEFLWSVFCGRHCGFQTGHSLLVFSVSFI